MDRLSHPEPSVIADEVALLSSGFANNVNVSELAGDHDDQQPPRLEASNSSPIEASPHSGRVPPEVAPGPATSSPSNAPTASAPSGVTSSVQFAISSQPLVSLGTLATPRTSSEDTPRAPSVAAHVEDDGPGRDSSLDTLQRPECEQTCLAIAAYATNLE